MALAAPTLDSGHRPIMRIIKLRPLRRAKPSLATEECTQKVLAEAARRQRFGAQAGEMFRRQAFAVSVGLLLLSWSALACAQAANSQELQDNAIDFSGHVSVANKLQQGSQEFAAAAAANLSQAPTLTLELDTYVRKLELRRSKRSVASAEMVMAVENGGTTKQQNQRKLQLGGQQQQPPGELLFSNQTGAIAHCGLARELARSIALAERQESKLRASNAGQQQPLGALKQPRATIQVRWEKDNGDQVEQVVYAASEPLAPPAEQHLHQLAPRRPLRHVRASDGALIFEPFMAHDYQADVHAATYRCVASSGSASLVSGDMRAKAVVLGGQSTGAGAGSSSVAPAAQLNSVQIEVLDELALEENSATFKCHIPAHASAYMQLVDWLEFPSETIHTVQSTAELFSGSLASSSSSFHANASQTNSVEQREQQTTAAQNRHFVHPKTGDLHVLNVVQEAQTSSPSNYQRSYKCRCRNKLTGELVSSASRGKLMINGSRAPLAPRPASYPAFAASAAPSFDALTTPGRFRLAFQQQHHHHHHYRQHQQDAQMSYLEGEPWAALVCQLQASPRADFTWFRRNHLLASESASVSTQILASSSASEHNMATLVPIEPTNNRYAQVENLLLIIAPNRNDSGQYVCQARNKHGEERLELQLQVRGHLRAHLSASANVLELGKSLALECQVSGFPIHQVVFRHNGQVIKSISGRETTPMDAATSGGDLRPFAARRQSKARADELTLREAESNYFVVDSSATTGDIRSNSGPSTAINQHLATAETPNAELEESTSSLEDEQRSTSLLSHVIVIELEPQHAGAYQCFAYNQYESVRSSQFIKVLDDPPQFRDTFKALIVEPRDDVSLLCSARATPLPAITWFVDDQPLVESRHVRIGDFVTRDHLLFSYVNISSVQVQDSGLYRCTADNGLARVAHEDQLSVRGGPLVKPMGNVTVLAGGAFRQRCPVAGHPLGEIQWFHEGKRLPINHRQRVYDNGTLEVEHMERSAGDEGEYVCQVSAPPASSVGPTTSGTAASSGEHELSSGNPTGSGGGGSGLDRQAASSSVLVSIRARPVIEPFIISRALREGQRASVMCTISSGDLPISISWFRNGQPLEAALFSPESKSGTQQLDEQASEPLLSNSSSAPPLPGVLISRVSDYSSTLLFESLLAKHSGNYTCLARNDAGSVSHQASMVVQVAPKWHIEPGDTSVVRGASSSVDCMASGFPPPRIIWTKASGDQLAGGQQQQQQQVAAGAQALKEAQRGSHHLGAWRSIVSSPHLQVFENGSLNILEARDSDQGHYMCQASNGVGAGLSKVIRITINVAAQFQQSRHSIQFVARGEQANLRCQARGDWPVSLHWLKNSRHRLEPINVLEQQQQPPQQLPPSGQQQPPPLLSSLSSSLLALPVGSSAADQVATRGAWSSNASSNGGLPQQQHWWLPSVWQLAGDQQRQATKNGLLMQRYSLINKEFLLSSSPSSSKSSSELVAELKAQRRLLTQQEAPEPIYGQLLQQHRPIVVQVESTLSIQQVERQDTSTFKCLALNQFGFDERTIQLVVQEPPDRIEELSVLEVNSRSITLGWLAPYDGNSPITHYHVQYSALGAATSLQTAASGAALASGEPLNSLGWFNYTLAVLAPTNSSPASTPTSRLELGPQARAPGLPIGASLQPLASSGARSLVKITISSLRPVTRYWFRVEPENKLGRGAISGVVESSTMEEAPGSAPSKLKALAQSSSSILVSWARLDDKEAFGQVQGYYVAYRPLLQEATGANQEAKNGSIVLQSGVQATTTTTTATSTYKTIQNDDKLAKFDALLTGLRRQTRYMITVQAFNARGTGPSSEPLVVTTLELDPPRQLKLFVKQSTNCSIQIEWRPQSQAALAKQAQASGNTQTVGDADVVDYYSLYQAELNEQPRWQESRLQGHATGHTIEGLKCGTRYQFYMMGVNRIGIGDQSDILDTKTAGSAPIAPDRQSTFDVINATCYVVRLDRWQDNGCPINRFNVRYRLESSRDWIQLAHFEQQAQGVSSPGGTSGSLEQGEAQPRADDSGGRQAIESNNSYAADATVAAAGLRSQYQLSVPYDDAYEEAHERARRQLSADPAMLGSDPLDSLIQEDDTLIDYPSLGALDQLEGDNVSADYLALEAAALIGKSSQTAPSSFEFDQVEEQRAGGFAGANNQLFSLLKDSMIPTFDGQRLIQSHLERLANHDEQHEAGQQAESGAVGQQQVAAVKMPKLAQDWQASNFVVERLESPARISGISPLKDDWRRVRLCNLMENLYYSVQIRAANRVGETEAELRLLTSQDGLEYDQQLKRFVVGRLGGRNNPPPETGGPLDRVMAHSMASFNESLFAFEQWPILVPITLALTLITVVVIITLLLKKTPTDSPGSSTTTTMTTTRVLANDPICTAGSGSANGGSNCSSSGYLDDVTPLNHPSSANHNQHFATLHHLPSHSGHSHSTSGAGGLHHMSMGTLKPHHLQRYHLHHQNAGSSGGVTDSGGSGDLIQGSSATENYATVGPAPNRCMLSSQQHQAPIGDSEAQFESIATSSPSFTNETSNLTNIYQQRTVQQQQQQQFNGVNQQSSNQVAQNYGFLLGQSVAANLLKHQHQQQHQLNSNGNSLADTQTSSNQTGSISPATSAPLSSINSGGSCANNSQAAPQEVTSIIATLPHGQHHQHHHHIDSRGLNVYMCPKEDDVNHQKSHQEQQQQAIFCGLAAINNLAQNQASTTVYGTQLRTRYQIADHVQQQQPNELNQQQFVLPDNQDNNNIESSNDGRLMFDPVYATIRRTFPQAFKYLTLQHNNNAHQQQAQQHQHHHQQQQQQQHQTDINFFESNGG